MDLEKNAIGILQTLCGNSGCVISDSGGKDSSVIKHLALKARQQYGLPFSVQHNHTTVDAPETVYFVREEKKRFEQMGIAFDILYPKYSMWQLIVKHRTPPTRLFRYCCADLKEYSGHGENLLRASVRRKAKTGKTIRAL